MYRVCRPVTLAKSGVLDFYEDSVSENTRLASRGIPKTVKRERKRKGTDAETVDLTNQAKLARPFTLIASRRRRRLYSRSIAYTI